MNQAPGLAAIRGFIKAGIPACKEHLRRNWVWGHDIYGGIGRASQARPGNSEIRGAQDARLAEIRLRGVLNRKIGRSRRTRDVYVSTGIRGSGLDGGQI